MGSPIYPTQAQLQKLREPAGRSAPEVQELKDGELSLTLPPNGLAVIADQVEGRLVLLWLGTRCPSPKDVTLWQDKPYSICASTCSVAGSASGWTPGLSRTAIQRILRKDDFKKQSKLIRIHAWRNSRVSWASWQERFQRYVIPRLFSKSCGSLVPGS